ncbi:MAG TPA: type I DNA topoisomerase [Spirochaetales bacterium]|nr:type I DNA topoisomerase [Spirochaetales bacterium]HPD79705.1 type I DNA topoisomerase [Spirochaetales bacterium]HQK33333.1 type I DNA topoisomerase [Spirochaetales bacterium]HRV27715.1 type I DNA topoisomerase [Spirochaetia bacterium]
MPQKAATGKSEEKKKSTSSAKKSKVLKQKILVIVESPAKAKTIEKYLGARYKVLASMGHLIDLPKSRLGIDIEHNFEPEYLTIRGKAKLLKELQQESKKSSLVLLASDNDREGEAIAYHIQRAIAEKVPDKEIKRIVFNEVTPHAIRDAVQEPHEIDEYKVSAQKARRILDRLVGYHLSPLLWKKVKNGLSAGRVQSVALRLICEREKEVEEFIPEEYWSLDAEFKKGRHKFSAELVQFKQEKPELKKETDVQAVIDAITGKPCIVTDRKDQEKTQRPKPPFTTSKLQQAAASRLGFTGKKTMQVAQQLYEGITIGSSRIGLITYMRTDSVRISPVALQEVRNYIKNNYPEELPEEPVYYQSAGKVQDAHEAIRPTIVDYTPDSIQKYLNRDQYRLYALIWEQFVASQMLPAKFLSTAYTITAGDAVFRASSSLLVQKGFYKVLQVSVSRDEREKVIPELQINEVLTLVGYKPEQHFTQGPSRYTDASIVKVLEEKGIGRPSTYAPIISTLLERYYITRENKQLVPTQLGKIINSILVEYFPDIIDVEFTANMENLLDEVEDAHKDWINPVRDFFNPFYKKVQELMETLESIKGKLDEPTEFVCDKCGKPMLKKLGRNGFFLACSGFPECRNTRSVPLARCPRKDCNGYIVARKKSRGKGRLFYGCTNYPQCDFVTYFKPSDTYCPKCGWFLVERYDKKNGYHKACINPDCDYLHTQEEHHD